MEREEGLGERERGVGGGWRSGGPDHSKCNKVEEGASEDLNP